MSTTRVRELEEAIMYHRDLYYNGTPEVEDDVFDALEDELRRLSPDSKILSGIGAPVVSKTKWVKTSHAIPMSSLNKANSMDDVIAWTKGSSEASGITRLSNTEKALSWTEKLDGISIALRYENSVLVSAVTRGDGLIGEDILANVVMMRGVQRTLTSPSRPITGTFRGEIVLTHDFYAQQFSDYSNPRNAAAGIARLEDRTKASRCQYLTVMVYESLVEGYNFDTETEKFIFIESLGFKTPSHGEAVSVKDLETLYSEYADTERQNLNYDIDGLVIRYNDQRTFERAGERNDRPYGAVALKFANEGAITTLKEIIWQVGNTGRVTPVAIFEPIELVGAVITRASLYNASNIRNMDLCNQDKILVERANDVIPKVLKVVEKINYDPVIIPTQCPSCNSTLVEEGEYLTCYASTCKARIAGNIKAWVESLDLLDWGEFVIDELVEREIVKTVADLYSLTENQIAELTNTGGAVVGSKTANKLLETLHGRKLICLSQFIGGLNIDMNRDRSVKQVMKAGYDTVESFLNASVDELKRIPGFGERKATALFEGLRDNETLIRELEKVIEVSDEKGVLTGKSFCITGSLDKPRKVLEKLIKDLGGDIKSGVTKDLSYLICNDKGSTSSKAKKAGQLGIEIITEEEFERICNG